MLAWGRSDISAPVSVTAGKPLITNLFQIPGNTTGVMLVTIPCDPAWALDVRIQESADKGATWDCQNTKASPCPGFSRPVSPCMFQGKPITNITVQWSQYDGAGKHVPRDPKKVMRLIIASNLTKTFTATVSFDP